LTHAIYGLDTQVGGKDFKGRKAKDEAARTKERKSYQICNRQQRLQDRFFISFKTVLDKIIAPTPLDFSSLMGA
jgi:hypothetical protein